MKHTNVKLSTEMSVHPESNEERNLVIAGGDLQREARICEDDKMYLGQEMDSTNDSFSQDLGENHNRNY